MEFKEDKLINHRLFVIRRRFRDIYFIGNQTKIHINEDAWKTTKYCRLVQKWNKMRKSDFQSKNFPC